MAVPSNWYLKIGKLIPAVIHIFDTAPPTSPKHDEDIEDFEEDEDTENMDAQPFSDEEEAEHVDKSVLSEDTEHVGRSAVSEEDDAVLVASSTSAP